MCSGNIGTLCEQTKQSPTTLVLTSKPLVKRKAKTPEPFKFCIVCSCGQTRFVGYATSWAGWEMLPKETRFWHRLSKQAVHEQDPAKLKIITDEINRILECKNGLPSSGKRGISAPRGAG